MNTKTWKVMADPAWKGKHPLHEARFVVTEDMDPIIGPENGDGGREWDSDAGEIICTMPDSERQKEHARLIAAAPELLALAEKVRAMERSCDDKGLFDMSVGDLEDVYAAARAAIAKATGE